MQNNSSVLNPESDLITFIIVNTVNVFTECSDSSHMYPCNIV